MIIKPVGSNPSIKNANSSFSYPTDRINPSISRRVFALYKNYGVTHQTGLHRVFINVLIYSSTAPLQPEVTSFAYLAR